MVRLLMAALVVPCASQFILHNVTFRVHIVLEGELMRRDNTCAGGQACRAHLEMGHLPAYAPYSGHLINIWNELRDRGGFEYEISEEYDDRSYTPAYDAVTTSQEPNTITLGWHWLHPVRAGSVHSVSLDSLRVSSGYRLRTWRREDTFIDDLIVLLQPLSWSLWGYLIAFVILTAILYDCVDQKTGDDRGGSERKAKIAAKVGTCNSDSFTRKAARKAQTAAMTGNHGEKLCQTIMVCCGHSEYSSKQPAVWILNFALSVFALIFVATYTANLTSLYTQPATDRMQSIHDVPPGTVVCTRKDVDIEYYSAANGTSGGGYADGAASIYYMPNLRSTLGEAAKDIKFLNHKDAKQTVDGLTPAQAEALGCDAVLDYVPRATWTVNNDPSCRGYIGWQGDDLLSYPTVLFHSPTTDPAVVKALNTLISTLRTDGFIERAYEHYTARKAACPSKGFERIGIRQYSGMFLCFVIPLYALAIAVRCCSFSKKLPSDKRSSDGLPVPSNNSVPGLGGADVQVI